MATLADLVLLGTNLHNSHYNRLACVMQFGIYFGDNWRVVMKESMTKFRVVFYSPLEIHIEIKFYCKRARVLKIFK